jgi:hypothetical protein
MFEGIRPFDWLMLVVEVLVLVIIAYEFIAEALRRRTDQKRRLFLNALVLRLSPLIDEGERIRSTAPDPLATTQYFITRWTDSVSSWTKKTEALIAGHSSSASATFMLISESQCVDDAVSYHGHHFFLSGPTSETHKALTLHLENLRRMVDRPEAYF